MGQIKSIGGVRVQGKIEKPYLFKDKLFKDDLSNYQWIDNEDRSELEVVLYQQQQRGNYYVDDQSGNVKVRGAGQKIFSDKVKVETVIAILLDTRYLMEKYTRKKMDEIYYLAGIIDIAIQKLGL